MPIQEASPMAQWVKNLPANARDTGDVVRFLGLEDPLEEDKATHSSILAWRSPWTAKPGGLQSKGSQRVRSDWVTTHARMPISVQFSRSVVSDSLRPHELQHARPPCPSPTSRAYPNSCPLSRWCHTTISSSAVPFSSCPQSFPAWRSFQKS